MRWRFWQRKAADASALTLEKLLGEEFRSKSGVTVSTARAMRVATALACGRVIAEGCAQLPLKPYREKANGGREPAKDLAVYRLLARQPNDWMSSFEFREMLTLHSVFTGGGFAFINRIDDEPRELIPLVPANVTVRQQPDWTLLYDLRDSRGPVGTYTSRDIFHLRGPSWNGYLGLDVIQQAREAIGLAIATEETQALLHGNGARPGGLLSVKGKMEPAAKDRLREDWNQSFGGQSKFRTAVVDLDASWTPMAMTGVDAQHLETRKHQIEEICRALRVFPQMIGYTDKTATFASAEAFFIAHVVHTLGPWIERWEQAINRDLLDGDPDLFAKHTVAGLLRGDNTSRSNFYKTMVLTGIMTRNEARSLEEMDPIEGLDEPLVPLNMASPDDVDRIAREAVDSAKAALGHNGGPPLDDEEIMQRVRRALTRHAA